MPVDVHVPTTMASAQADAPLGLSVVPTSAGTASTFPTCTPETLYLHVVGRWPAPELGAPMDHANVHGVGRGVTPLDVGPSDPLDLDTRNDSSHAAAARAKKRRKVQRRSKVSEIWFPRAEMAFCTCVASIPPNGRTKIKFFGRPLGRNELIAAICTLATQRMYNRKQISSHSQVLKDKVPPPYKEIFTFEDKARGGDDPAENSTANVIENYPFPETIYNIINYPVGTDLANAPKPQWLQDLEARGNDASPTNETSTRQYNYWNNPSEYSAGGGYYDRDAGLYGSKIKLERDARDTGVDSTYAYSYSQSHPSSRQQQGQLPPSFSIHQPPPHTLPPLGSSRDVDPHGVSLQPPNTASSLGESTSSAGRYTYGSTGQAALSARSNVWEGEHSRSPTSTNSAFEAAGSTAVSPRRSTSATVPSAWQDVKPSLLHEGLSGEHLTLPPLQEPPSSYTAPGGSGNSSTDWKSRAVYGDTKWATSAATLAAHSPSQRSGLPAMALPSIGLVASQTTSSYGATPSSAASPWSTTSGAFGVTPSWDASRTRMPTFAISSIEVMARTGDTMVSLTSESQILSSTPIPWNQVYMYRARYPFLEAVSTAPGVPVYHIDMPLALPAEYTARLALLDSVSELGLSTTLRQTPDSNTWSNDWVMTTESGYLQPRGPTRYSRTVSPLRHQPSGGYNGHSRLPELARLYEHLVRLGGATDESGSMPDALASVGAPMTMLVQRVARDGFQTQSTTTVDDDWTSAAAIIIYSFFITTDEAPRAVPVCRSVDFDAPPLPDDLTNEQLVANLFAGEQHLRSKFPYL